MQENFTMIETSYNVDFAGHNYAVVHIETVNNGDVKRKTECLNKFYEAKNTFNNLVELEKFCYINAAKRYGINNSYLAFVTGNGAHKDDKAFGVYDTRDGELISQVLLFTNPALYQNQ